MILFRNLLLALAALLFSGTAFSAGSFRYMKPDPGPRGDTFTDDELIAKRLRWPSAQSPIWTVYRDYSQIDPLTNERGVIVPGFNQDPFFPPYTQGRVMEVINNSISEWNDAGSNFNWSSSVVPSDFWSGFEPTLPRGPELWADLDGFNLITFQDPLTVIEPPTEDGAILGINSIFFFNQDVDLSDINNLPGFVASVYFTEFLSASLGIFITPEDIIRLRLTQQFYSAGSIIDSDIIFNQNLFYRIAPEDPPDDPAERERWNGFNDFIPFITDIEAVCTHEMGHAAGLAHSQLSMPTMAPFYNEDIWHGRNLDFDDKLSIKMAYQPLFSRLGKGAITGRVLNGDAFDGVIDETFDIFDFITDIENTPVFIGRPTADEYFGFDDISGVDEITSQVNRLRMFAVVHNSQKFRIGLGFNAVSQPDSRYFIPGLPSSLEELKRGDGEFLPPNGYALYVQPGFVVDEVTAFFSPIPELIPPEFYGGTFATNSYFQPGFGSVDDPNTPGDLQVQDNWLQFAFNQLGQFSLALAQSTFSLIDDFPQFPTQSYLTYRIIKNGVTTDVPNFQSNNIVTSGMVENDLANSAEGVSTIADSIVSTETIELGRFRADGLSTSSASDMRITVRMQNVTSSTIQAGLRFLIRPVVQGQNVHFFINGQEYDREAVLTGGAIPASFLYAPNENSELSGLATLSNPAGFITTPDKLIFADFTQISAFNQSNGNFFNYVPDNRELTNSAYAVVFNPRTLLPGAIVTFSTDVGYVRSNSSPVFDGPIAGPLDGVPGADDPFIYYPVDVTTNSVTTGIDILTNTGTPGGLSAGPTTPGGGGGGTNPLGDADNDSIINILDNCVFVPNTNQLDIDNDAVGDVCDQDFVTFTDISPIAPGSDRKDAIPNQPLYTLGATFGDLNNDGFPELALANGLPIVQTGAPVNRLYLNIASPSANEPGGRRYVDVTFGVDGIADTLDDRMPYLSVSSKDIRLADFDNDGDLDMFISNFETNENPTIGAGAQNFFFENIDVDDSTLNPSPDADSFGDAFFVDATNRWDPGILNFGPNVPYPHVYLVGNYFGSVTGFDVSTHSDVGDIDCDGDIDVVVSNANAFNDIIPSAGINTQEGTDPGTPIFLGGLRFSERVLINHTREPANPDFGPVPPGFPYRFRDETLGEDQVFGEAQDRMPPLKPEWATVSDTNAFDEVDYSNTQQVKLSHFFNSNALSINVFDKRNPNIVSNGDELPAGFPSPTNTWDGDDLSYINFDNNGDGVPDGIFGCFQYGFESWLAADDGTILNIGIPQGLPGDAPGAETDEKAVENDSSISGLVLDADYTGWNEMVSFNTTSNANHNVFTNRNGYSEADRGRIGSLAAFGGGARAAIDYFLFPGSVDVTRRREQYALTHFGRPRDALTDDLNSDGLPDIGVANDSVTTADIINLDVPPGNKTFYINQDYLAPQGGHTGWLEVNGNGPVGRSLITNELHTYALSFAAADFDLDGDIDLFSGTAGTVGNFYRNNQRTAGRGVTLPSVGSTASVYDAPLFIDQSYELLPPYFGLAFDPVTGSQPIANMTFGTALGDMDRDGDLDLVFANGGIFHPVGEYQMVFKNNSKPLNPGEHVFTPAGSPYTAPYLQSNPGNAPWLNNVAYRAYDVKFTDLNDDGSPDIFFSVNGASSRLYINVDSDDNTRNSAVDADSVPDGLFVEQDRLPGISDPRRLNGRRSAIGDINGDGHPDIVIANADNRDGAPNLVLINRIGAFGWGYFNSEEDTRIPQVSYSPSGQGQVLDDTVDVALVDVDNDGDLDIIFVNRASLSETVSPNFYPYCRLLINNGSGIFSEVTDAGHAGMFVDPSRRIIAPERWPMITRPGKWEGIVVADFGNRGEAGEDVNGNSVFPYKVIEETEDRNRNGFVDFTDTGSAGSGGAGSENGRRDVSFDLFFCNGDSASSSVLLMNGGAAGAFGNGTFTEETASRFAVNIPFPCFGGDAGDVNADGLQDLVLALDTSSNVTGGGNPPAAKIPISLLLNTAASGTSTNAGFFVDVTGYDGVTSAGQFAASGELPYLKVQFPPPGSEGNLIAGNCRSVKLGDVDTDGDLDIIIGQAGRGSIATAGYMNHILLNMINPANFASRDVLSVRDPGGPILRSVAPAMAAQGQILTVLLRGDNFAGRPQVDFGAGITVLETSALPIISDSMTVRIRVAANAQTGSRVIKVTNPDGEYTYSSNKAFQVIDASLMEVTAVQEDWQLYQ
ncbi:MAG: matrixin family metalloprotease [Candidatus Sumerlaeaceae bacterium]